MHPLAIVDQSTIRLPQVPGDSRLGAVLIEQKQKPVFQLRNIVSGIHDEAEKGPLLAKAIWYDAFNKTGWSHLAVHLENDGPSDMYKAYAAGLLEGFLTFHHIRDFYLNTRGLLNPLDISRGIITETREIINKKLNAFFEKSQWNESNIFSKSSSDVFEQQIFLNILQLWGMADGYASRREHLEIRAKEGTPTLDIIDMHLFSSDGDIPDILRAVENHKGFSVLTTLSKAKHHIIPRCSGLARLSKSKSLFLGHTTWESYSEMIRIIKYYDFPYKNVSSKIISMSSYPGSITSTDDFILTSTGLAAIETTLEISDPAIITKHSNFFKPSGNLMDFMYPLVASRLATNAKHWIALVEKHVDLFLNVASSQWMVVDFSKLRSAFTNHRNLIFLFEIVPGSIKAKDVTADLLKEGYIFSANSAKLLNHSNLRKKSPVPLSNPMIPKGNREEVFRMLAPEIETLQDMQKVMQFSFSEEKLSISPRFDSDLRNPIPQGGVDTKITSNELIYKDMSFVAISGPSHFNRKPFSWTKNGRNIFSKEAFPHYGMPDKWDFSWQLVTPSGLKPLNN